MKIRRPSPALLFTLITAAVTVLLTAFRTVALFTNFDPRAQHYMSPVLEGLATYGFLLLILVFIPLAVLLPKETPLTRLGEGKRFFYLPLSVLFAASAIELFVTAAVEQLTALAFLFAVLAAVMAGTAALPYLFKLLRLPVSDTSQQLLLACSSLYMILYAMFVYFDEHHYMNNPNAILVILTAVVLALLFFYDARSLSENASRLTLFFMASGFSLAVSTALPSLIYRILSGGGLVSSLVFELLLLSAALPLGIRLFILSQKTYGGTDE